MIERIEVQKSALFISFTFSSANIRTIFETTKTFASLPYLYMFSVQIEKLAQGTLRELMVSGTCLYAIRVILPVGWVPWAVGVVCTSLQCH